MVYYFGKPVEYIYDEERVTELLKDRPKNGCLTVTPEDINTAAKLKLIKSFKTMSLYKL
jgi:hypothetical protein